MEYTYHFEKLEVWNQSRQVVIAVYKLLKKFPSDERFALCEQLRRAVISVPSNIAEGISRVAIKETIHFLEIAFGSLMEVYCQLQIAVDLQYITDDDFKQIKPLIISTSRLLNGLHKAKMNQLPTAQ
jgi:four helix bundle protein